MEDLEMLLMKPLLHCQGGVSFTRISRPGPFAEKTAPKHDVSTPMLHSRYGVLWMQLSILSPPNTTS